MITAWFKQTYSEVVTAPVHDKLYSAVRNGDVGLARVPHLNLALTNLDNL